MAKPSGFAPCEPYLALTGTDGD
ncbi:hypothetical protein CCACVL1_14445 [Corchorus capsularis]|uniref:Uncharacterized protein n=1 Tax=Corchorus capsularis TaxID=210143 RepID=A0A1R3I748_COCAP|nr:hypothetical protein CCACVL1_14445 [Corchorus capsularis]